MVSLHNTRAKVVLPGLWLTHTQQASDVEFIQPNHRELLSCLAELREHGVNTAWVRGVLMGTRNWRKHPPNLVFLLLWCTFFFKCHLSADAFIQSHFYWNWTECSQSSDGLPVNISDRGSLIDKQNRKGLKALINDPITRGLLWDVGYCLAKLSFKNTNHRRIYWPYERRTRRINVEMNQFYEAGVVFLL